MTDANQSDAVVTNQQDTALLRVAGEVQAFKPFVEWLVSLNPELPDDFQISIKDPGTSLINLGHLRKLIAAFREQAKPSASCEAGEVERVARAIKSVWDVQMQEEADTSGGVLDFEPGPWEEWIPEARAAIAALRANAPEAQGEVERLRIMSKQKLFEEMDEEERENGDFEGAYDWFVRESRAIYAALASGAGDEG